MTEALYILALLVLIAFLTALPDIVEFIVWCHGQWCEKRNGHHIDDIERHERHES